MYKCLRKVWAWNVSLRDELLLEVALYTYM